MLHTCENESHHADHKRPHYLDVPLVQRARDNEDDIVNHVPIGAVVHEGGQRVISL